MSNYSKQYLEQSEMRGRYFKWIAALALIIHSFTAVAQNVRIPEGIQPNGTGSIRWAFVSSDGDSVLFRSDATNLIPSQPITGSHVYRYRFSTAQTTLVSLREAAGTIPAFGVTASTEGGSAISADGRYIVYETTPPTAECIWVDTETQTRLNVRVTPTQPDCRQATISPDGRYVGFVGNAFPSFGVPASNCFLFDTQAPTATARIISRTLAGNPANGACSSLALSRNADFASFTEISDQLIVGDTNGVADAFVWSKSNNTVSRINGTGGIQPDNFSLRTDISADGSKVVFTSRASNLVAGDTNDVRDIFLFSRATSAVTRISLSNGQQVSGSFCDYPRISDDGRWVVFDSNKQLAPPVHPGRGVFRFDTQTGTMSHIGVPNNQDPPNGFNQDPDVANSGRTAFTGGSSNLIVGDTNGIMDIFISNLGVAPSGTPPALAFQPNANSTLTFTGGSATIQISPTGGTGGGAAATTRLSNCAFSGNGATSFILPNVNLQFLPGGPAQSAIFNCSQGSTQTTATLTCSEVRGTETPLSRVWIAVCPINPQQPTITSITQIAPSTPVQYDPIVVRFSVTGANAPAGIVNVTATPGTQGCTATVAQGECSFSIPTVGTYQVRASYGGDAQNAPSQSIVNNITITTNTAVAPVINFPDPAITLVLRDQVGKIDMIPQGGSGTGPNSLSTVTCTLSGPNADRFSILSGPSFTFGPSSLMASAHLSCTRTSTQSDALLTCIGRRGVAGPSISHTQSLICPPQSGYTTTVSIGDVVPNQPNTFESANVSVNVISNQAFNINPSGDVHITLQPGGVSCTARNNSWSTSTANCSLQTVPPGSYMLNARYVGDGAFAPSESSRQLTVVRAQPTLTVENVNPASANIGQPMNVRLGISSQWPIEITGQLEIRASNSSDTGCMVDLPARECLIRVGASGQRTFSVHYLGDQRYAPVTSGSFLQVTGFGTTQSTATIEGFNPGVPQIGQSVIITGRVIGNSPTGSLAFLSGSTELCRAALQAANASCSFVVSQSGTLRIRAAYSGNANNAAATSGEYTLAVGSSTPLAPTVVYNPLANSTITLTNGSGTLSFVSAGGTGTGVSATTTINCQSSQGFFPQSFSAFGLPGQNPSPQLLNCVQGPAAQSGILTCNESSSTQPPRSSNWTLVCPAVGASSAGPTLNYNPVAGSTIQVDGTANLLVTPSGGAGSVSSTLSNCAVGGAGFGISPTNITLTPGGSSRSIAINCTRGTITLQRELSCAERIGTGSPTQRSWTLRCPSIANQSQTVNLEVLARVVRTNPVSGVLIDSSGSRVFEGDRPRLVVRVRNRGSVTYSGNLTVSQNFPLISGALTTPIVVPPNQEVEPSWNITVEGRAWAGNVPGGREYQFNATLNNNAANSTVTMRVLPRPVQLVNGILSSGDTWNPLRQQLPDGLVIRSANYPSTPNFACYRISCNADILSAEIQAQRLATGSAQVDIVSHSRGGLISREYIGRLMGQVSPQDSRPIVRRLITAGTPHRGSSCAILGTGLLASANGWSLLINAGLGDGAVGTPLGDLAEVGFELSELFLSSSAFPYDLTEPLSKGVIAIAYGGTDGRSLCPPLPHRSDLVVAPRSSVELGAGWKCPRPLVASSLFYPVGFHMQLHRHFENVQLTILPALRGEFDQSASCSAPQAVNLNAAADNSFTQLAAFARITSSPGINLHPVRISGRGLTTVSTVSDSDLTIELLIDGLPTPVRSDDKRREFIIENYSGQSAVLRVTNSGTTSRTIEVVGVSNQYNPEVSTLAINGRDVVLQMTGDVPAFSDAVITEQGQSFPVEFVRNSQNQLIWRAPRVLRGAVNVEFRGGTFMGIGNALGDQELVFGSGFEQFQ